MPRRKKGGPPPASTSPLFLLAFLPFLLCLPITALASSWGNNPDHGDGQYNEHVGNDGPAGERKGPPPGPWTTRAGEELKTSSGLISAQEAAAASAAAAAARNVRCNGATCDTAASVARLAHTSAATVVSTASSRLARADELRKQMLAELGSGRYSTEEVSRVRNLLREDPAPKEREISALPEKVRDLARGLGTNFREMQLLDQKRAQYGRVAAGARDMSQKLKGNEERAETIRPASAGSLGIGLGGRESASYPRKKDGKLAQGGTSGRDSLITGGTAAFQPRGFLDEKLISPKLFGGGQVPGTGASAIPSAGERQLTRDGADLIAGMISELDYDMSKKLADSHASATHALPGAPGLNSMPEGVDPGSVVGEALLTQARGDRHPQSGQAPAQAGKTSSGRALASIDARENLEFLGADVDLFRRVNEQMRRRASGMLGP